MGAAASVLGTAIWLAASYSSAGWTRATVGVAALVTLYALGDAVAQRLRKPFAGIGAKAAYTAPVLLFFFPIVARIEHAVASPSALFGVLFALLALIAWRALATSRTGLYFVAAFFAVTAEASWSASNLTVERLGAAVALYAIFGVFYLGVPLVARRLGRQLEPPWGGGIVLIASLMLLLYLAGGPHAAAALWGLALLLAILDAGLFVESASGRLPLLTIAGGVLSWIVLAVWWSNAAAVVGLLPSLVVLIGLTLVMLTGHAWAHADLKRRGVAESATDLGFRHGAFLGLGGHLFLLYVAVNPEWSVAPWPLLGALGVMTLAVSATSLAAETPPLHAGAAIAAAMVVLAWVENAMPGEWARTGLVAAEAVVGYALAWLPVARRIHRSTASRPTLHRRSGTGGVPVSEPRLG